MSHAKRLFNSASANCGLTRAKWVRARVLFQRSSIPRMDEARGSGSFSNKRASSSAKGSSPLLSCQTRKPTGSSRPQRSLRVAVKTESEKPSRCEKRPSSSQRATSARGRLRARAIAVLPRPLQGCAVVTLRELHFVADANFHRVSEGV